MFLYFCFIFEQYCKDNNLKGYVRLNGTSDIKWEDYVDMSKYNLYFYDYTKRQDRDFSNYKIEIVKVNYEFVKGGNEMLVIDV